MPVILKCDYCDKEIVKSPSKVVKNNFCSKACHKAYVRDYIGFTTCAQCGKRFKRKRVNRLFCSRACQGVSQRKELETRKCLMCGRAFECEGWRPTVYCSRSCASRSKGKKVPSWFSNGARTEEVLQVLQPQRVCKHNTCTEILPPDYIGLYCKTCIGTYKTYQRHQKRYLSHVASGKIKHPGVGSGGAQWGRDNHQFKDDCKTTRTHLVRNYRTLYKKAYGEIKCEVCGNKDGVVVHHIDGDRGNFDNTNFCALCRETHIDLHKETRRFGDDKKKYVTHFKRYIAKLKSRNEAGKPCGG